MAKKTMAMLEYLDALKAAITVLKRKEKTLTKLGCVNGSIQFKYDPPKDGVSNISNRMVLRHAVDAKTGKRQVDYIGIDPTAQAKARAQIERFAIRQSLQDEIAQLEKIYAQYKDEMAALTENLTHAARVAEGIINRFA